MNQNKDIARIEVDDFVPTEHEAPPLLDLDSLLMEVQEEETSTAPVINLFDLMEEQDTPIDFNPNISKSKFGDSLTENEYEELVALVKDNLTVSTSILTRAAQNNIERTTLNRKIKDTLTDQQNSFENIKDLISIFVDEVKDGKEPDEDYILLRLLRAVKEKPSLEIEETYEWNLRDRTELCDKPKQIIKSMSKAYKAHLAEQRANAPKENKIDANVKNQLREHKETLELIENAENVYALTQIHINSNYVYKDDKVTDIVTTTQFTCGHCGEKSTANKPMYYINALTRSELNGSRDMQKRKVATMGANKCEHCESVNVLPIAALNIIREQQLLHPLNNRGRAKYDRVEKAEIAPETLRAILKDTLTVEYNFQDLPANNKQATNVKAMQNSYKDILAEFRLTRRKAIEEDKLINKDADATDAIFAFLKDYNLAQLTSKQSRDSIKSMLTNAIVETPRFKAVKYFKKQYEQLEIQVIEWKKANLLVEQVMSGDNSFIVYTDEETVKNNLTELTKVSDIDFDITKGTYDVDKMLEVQSIVKDELYRANHEVKLAKEDYKHAIREFLKVDHYGYLTLNEEDDTLNEDFFKVLGSGKEVMDFLERCYIRHNLTFNTTILHDILKTNNPRVLERVIANASHDKKLNKDTIKNAVNKSPYEVPDREIYPIDAIDMYPEAHPAYTNIITNKDVTAAYKIYSQIPVFHKTDKQIRFVRENPNLAQLGNVPYTLAQLESVEFKVRPTHVNPIAGETVEEYAKRYNTAKSNLALPNEAIIMGLLLQSPQIEQNIIQSNFTDNYLGGDHKTFVALNTILLELVARNVIYFERYMQVRVSAIVSSYLKFLDVEVDLAPPNISNEIELETILENCLTYNSNKTIVRELEYFNPNRAYALLEETTSSGITVNELSEFYKTLMYEYQAVDIKAVTTKLNPREAV